MGTLAELRFIPVGQFHGDDESVPSIGLPVAYSSGGSRNIWFDQFGVASSIYGYSRTNPAAIVSQTGGAAMRIRAIYHYNKQTIVGGVAVVTRQEIAIFDDGVSHCEFRYSTDGGATWTFVEDLGPTSCNAIPDFSQSGNVLIMTNGVIVPRQWDGAALTAALGSQIAGPTYTSVSDTGNLSGNYQYRVVPIKTDGTRKLASAASTIAALANKRTGITWIADPDPTVQSYEVYRKTGTGVGMYFVNATLTPGLNDNLADADLIQNRALQEYGDAPPIGTYFCELHAQRMWYLRTDTDPRRAYYGDVGLPFSVYKESAYFDFSDAESFSDRGQGATGNFKRMLVIWLERSIWTISGSGRILGADTDFARKRTTARTGTVSHRTVARVPKGAKFLTASGDVRVLDDVSLAYLTPLGDIRVFDGDNDEIISAAKAVTLRRLNYAQRRKSWSVTDTARGEVTWCYPADTSDEPNLSVTWNYNFGSWAERSWAFGHAIESESSDDSSLLYAGEADLTKGGLMYLLWDGTTFDGTPIDWAVMLKTLYGTGNANVDATGDGSAQLISYDKRWRWVDVLFKTSGLANLIIEWLPGEASDVQDGETRTVAAVGTPILTSDGQAIQTSDLQPLFAVLTPSVLRAKFLRLSHFQDGLDHKRYPHSRGMRLRISSTSSTAVVSIVGLNIAYQLLHGLKRVFRR